jgi:hypothetical protein
MQGRNPLARRVFFDEVRFLPEAVTPADRARKHTETEQEDDGRWTNC